MSHAAGCSLAFPRTKTSVQRPRRRADRPDPHLADGLRIRKLSGLDRQGLESISVATLMLFPGSWESFPITHTKMKPADPTALKRGPRTLAGTPKAASH